MTTNSGQTDIDRVRDATDLVRLISEHVSLTPRGREHVGLCPFHDDHRPSMAVVTHKGSGFYNCFACGASGDAFRFVMDYHKMDFGEALRYLADRAGITLTPRSVSARAEGGGDGVRRADLFKALDFANDFFRRTLADPAVGAAARAALADRGLDAAAVERFSIGAAPPGFSTLLDRLGGKASAIRTAAAAGLLRTRDDGGRYDAFRNRLMFPIRDEVGRTIAFGARIIDPEDKPKYLNSPESAVFSKSRTLYGLDLARRAIIDAGEAIVTEGYTDVIACHRAGIENVVGTLGTALTTQHASMLARLCPTVVLVFDGDEAGRKAADRAIEVFFREPVDMMICVLPEGQDPDDLVRQEDGPARFRAAVADAVDALEYKLHRFEADLGAAAGLSGRQRAVEAFLAELGELGFGALQGVRKRFVLTRLADLTGLPIPEVERAIPRPTRRREPARADETPMRADAPVPDSLIDVEPVRTTASRARAIAERDVLAVLLVEPAAGRTACIPTEDGPATVGTILSPNDFADPVAREIAGVVFRGLDGEREPGMSEVLAQLSPGPASSMAAELFREGARRLGADGESLDAAADLLAEAVASYRQCIEREAFHRPGPAAVTAEMTGDAAAGISKLLDHLGKRSRQGDVPAAISRGVRS